MLGPTKLPVLLCVDLALLNLGRSVVRHATERPSDRDKKQALQYPHEYCNRSAQVPDPEKAPKRQNAHH